MDESKIRLVYRGADTTKFNPATISQEQIADFMTEHHIPTDKPVIMLQGRLTHWKGQLAMIEALTKMTHKEISVLFIGHHQGRTDYYNELNERIKQLPSETTVLTFAVAGKEMPTVLALSDIAVSASLKPEPFGRAMPEAQAMGKVVVAFNHGGAAETVKDSETGFLVSPCDTEALAKKLDEILDMPLSERQKIGQNAIRSVHENFSVQAMQEKTLSVYKEIHSCL